MAYLEQEGYITRPHTSAGGVPSDKGYRYYVESLGSVRLPLDEQRLVSHLFHQVEGEMEQWLTLAARLMARLAQNMAVVSMPKAAACHLQRLELVALQGSRALLVLILRSARVGRQLITFDEAVSQSRLALITDKLNAAYAGLTRPQIVAKEMELSPTEQLITDSLVKIMKAEDEQSYEEPYLDGLHFMLGQPEFTHGHRIQGLMEMVEQRSLLKVIVPRELGSREVRVIIGGENSDETIRDCSVVIGRYGLPGEAVGTVGIIGPTRMAYPRAISTVGYLSAVLSGLVAELYGREISDRLSQNDTN